MRYSALAPLAACLLLTASCQDGGDLFDPEKNDYIDSSGKLSREDFARLRDLNSYQGTEAGASANIIEPPVPDLAEILAMPKPPKIGETQLVSVAVTDDVPLKDVLIELARLADVDIEVDAGITGGIVFRAKDRPFNEVVERIADLAGLRYEMKNNVLRVERDSPYVQEYALDFLSADRGGDSGISINTSAGGSGTSSSSSGSSSSSSGSSSGGGSVTSNSTTSGSNAVINLKAKADFWEKFEQGVDQILKYQFANRLSSTTVAVQQGAPPSAQGAPSGATQTQQSQASGAGTPTGGPAQFYVINRQAGTLTASATQKQHDLIKRFIRKIEANSSAQVLIEAKIIEVSLSDKFQTGIDWTQLGDSRVVYSGEFNSIDTEEFATPGTLTVLDQGLFKTGIDLSAAVSLAEKFGTVRALSSPRLHAMNNQQAVLTFAQNFIYFDVEIEVTPGTTSGTTTTEAVVSVNADPVVVPVGVLLSMQPSINMETNEVTLSVRPTLSRIVDTVSDPSIPIAAAQAIAEAPELEDLIANLRNEVPVVEVRELDSVLKLKSGQVMVIGGLMQDNIANTDAGLPHVSSVPWFGNLFKSVDKNNSLKELVIFIRATIVSSAGNADPADKAVYEKFIQDPRPIKF